MSRGGGFKLLRSVLFTPADLKKSFVKVLDGPADCIIFDLEDSVHPDFKASARKSVSEFLSSDDYISRKNKKTVVVRVNCPYTTSWGKEDFDMIYSANIDGVLIPKVNTKAQIDELLDQNKIPSTLPIWAMIETAIGIMNVDKIVTSSQIDTVVFGSNDLTKDLKAKHTQYREPLIYAMSRTIIASRAYQKYVIDGVHLDIHDQEGLIRSCIQGRNLGFDGKSLIHPGQITLTNQYFSPSPEEIQHAKHVIATYEDTLLHGKAVCLVDNKVVEALHVEQARIILQTAEKINQAENNTKS